MRARCGARTRRRSCDRRGPVPGSDRAGQAGDYAKACPLFEQSFQLDPSALGAELHLADCNEHLGRLASAWGQYHDVEDRAERTHDDKRAAYAHEHAEALAPPLSKIRIVAPEPRPVGFVVKRDGTDVTKIIGVPMPVDAGKHSIEASAPGFVTATKGVDVAGEGAIVVVELPPLVVAPTPPPPPRKVVDIDDTARVARKRLAKRLVIASGVALVATLPLGAYAAAQHGTISHHCDFGHVCDATGASATHAAFAAAISADVLAGIAAALAVTGVVVYLTAPQGKVVERTIAIVPTLGGAAVIGHF